MRIVSNVLASEELHSEEYLHSTLDEGLEGLFQRRGVAGEFSNGANAMQA